MISIAEAAIEEQDVQSLKRRAERGKVAREVAREKERMRSKLLIPHTDRSVEEAQLSGKQHRQYQREHREWGLLSLSISPRPTHRHGSGLGLKGTILIN